MLREWGRRGKAHGEFDFPIGIVVDGDGTICVSDFYNARVQCFSPEGEFLSSFGVLPNPGGLAVDRDGNLYLTHFSAMKLKEEPKPDRVSVYTRDGELLASGARRARATASSTIPAGSR